MNKLIVYFVLFIFLTLPSFVQAQEVEMADKFKEEGKIYVVITVFAIILTGLFVYLFLLDRKISKLEKEERD